ncbi:MAG: CBS domain-containing protein [Rhizobiaceae bacterium]
MNAGDLMTTGAATVHPWDTVSEAVATMVNYGVSGLPVVDKDGGVVGIVTERDLLRRVELGTEHKRPRWLDLWFEPGDLAEEYSRAHGRKVEDVMTRDVVTADVEMPASELATLMQMKGIKRLPVLRNGKLVGIVSRANLITALSRRLNQPEAVAAEDIELRRRVLDEIVDKAWARGASIDVHVREGKVALRGNVGDERVARAMRVTAENTPGVKEVVSLLRSLPQEAGNA